MQTLNKRDACDVVVGIDPGGAATGIVAREGDTLVGWCLLERDRDQSFEHWVRECAETARTFVAKTEATLVAIEMINEPTWHVRQRPITVLGILDTQAVIGALLVSLPNVVLVPPGGNGSGPLLAYPKELVGAREHRGTGYRRHLRSAWDLAGAGERMATYAPYAPYVEEV